MLSEAKSASGGAEEKTVAAGTENQNPPAPAPKKKSSCWLVGGIIIAVVIVLLLIASFLGFRLFTYPAMLLSNYFDKTGNNSAEVGVSKNVDPALVGNWDTGCLVPDSNSPWAERHTFTISSNGTANHKRYSGNSCAAIAEDHNDNINFTIPSSGKINLTYTSGIAAGSTSYDIYKVSGDTLRFGHGFCNCSKDLATGDYGLTEATRFSLLNEFLVYKKQ